MTIWGLVPESTLLVYESNSFYEDRSEIINTDSWKAISGIPLLDQSSSLLDDLGISGHLESLSNESKVLISVHQTSSDGFGFTVFLEIKNIEQHQLLSDLMTQLKEEKGLRSHSRVFEKYTITEWLNKESEIVAGSIFLGNVLVVSGSPILIDDVVRTQTDPTIRSFFETNPALFETQMLEKDQGNLYVNTGKIKNAFKTFLKPGIMDKLSFLPLASSTVFDVTIQDPEGVSLNGFTKAGTNDFLTDVQGVDGRSLDLIRRVPDFVSYVIHMSQDGFFPKDTILKSINDQYGSIRQELGEEVALLENAKGERICLLRARDVDELFEVLKDYGSAISNGQLYIEEYGENEIYQIPQIDFLLKLLETPLFSGFQESYFVRENDVIAIGSTPSVLEDFIDAQREEDVWGKSIERSKIINSFSQEANLSFFIDVNKFWALLLHNLKDDYKTHFEGKGSVLRSMDLATLQFSSVQSSFYTNFILNYSGRISSSKSSPSKALGNQITFGSDLVTKPQLIKNHFKQEMGCFPSG